jgi:hypothetical protein
VRTGHARRKGKVVRKGVLLAVGLFGCSGSPFTAVDPVSLDDAGSELQNSPEASVPDAGTPEAGAQEAGAPEAGAPEAGAPEAGAPEAGAPEAGAPEAGTPDAFSDAAPPVCVVGASILTTPGTGASYGCTDPNVCLLVCTEGQWVNTGPCSNPTVNVCSCPAADIMCSSTETYPCDTCGK